MRKHRKPPLRYQRKKGDYTLHGHEYAAFAAIGIGAVVGVLIALMLVALY